MVAASRNQLIWNAQRCLCVQAGLSEWQGSMLVSRVSGQAGRQQLCTTMVERQADEPASSLVLSLDGAVPGLRMAGLGPLQGVQGAL